MEEMYWQQFLETGKVEDYLTYKGMEICRQVMKKHEGEPSDEPDNSDGHGTGRVARGGI